ncbi:MAG: DUF501 domain-containing protein [Actinomycetaceae bacterium]|nr:DUF501 domain-containing protein [Actinomycetaceae bacterium]
MTENNQISQADLDIIALHLERVPRGVIGIGARCHSGHPSVVLTAPRLDDGSPFPTLYYLSCPGAVYGCSALEAEHYMEELQALVETDPQVAGAYYAAHVDYIATRRAFGNVPQIEGISAGGMPTRVKCLHALVGHALAAGPGVNPIGDLAIEEMQRRNLWSPESCKA